MNEKKPWLDSRGHELSTEQLKEISKSWDLKTWERYANSLDVQAQGKSLKPGEFRKLEEQQTQSIFADANQSVVIEGLKQKIERALQALSPRQREVIEAIYYNGQSLGETAQNLSLSKATVFEYKTAALINLKRVLSADPNDLAAYEGVSDLRDELETAQEELQEIMNEDIFRNELSRSDFDKGDF